MLEEVGFTGVEIGPPVDTFARSREEKPVPMSLRYAFLAQKPAHPNGGTPAPRLAAKHTHVNADRAHGCVQFPFTVTNSKCAENVSQVHLSNSESPQPTMVVRHRNVHITPRHINTLSRRNVALLLRRISQEVEHGAVVPHVVDVFGLPRQHILDKRHAGCVEYPSVHAPR